MSIYQSDCLYFEVTGALLKHVREYKRGMDKFHSDAVAFCTRFGATEFRVTGGVVAGLVWSRKKPLPDNWRFAPRENKVIIPYRNNPEGKALTAEMHAVAEPSLAPLFDAADIPAQGFVGNRVIWTDIFKFGKRVVLFCAKDKSLLSKKRHPSLKPIPGWKIVKLEEVEGLKALQVA